MILENIKNFDWYNEPQNVQFIEEGLLISTKPQTDFWQSADYNFYKDDGHLFAEDISGDFVLVTKWHFSALKDSAQCGLMVRADKQNWIKAGVLSPNPYHPQIGVVVASLGSSDWSMVNLPLECKNIWFKLLRRGKDFVVYYSLDGEKFEQIRMLHLSKAAEIISAGAYACSPKDEGFECILEDLTLKHV